MLLAPPTRHGVRGATASRCTRWRGPPPVAQAAGGVELAGVRQTASGIRADAVLTRGRAREVAAAGVKVALKRNKKGQTVTEQARRAWRPAASTSGARGTSRAASATSCTTSRRSNPQLVKLEVLGRHAPGPRAHRAEGHAGRPRRAPTDRGRRSCTRRTSTRASGSASRSTGACCTTSSTGWRANDKEIKDLLKTHRAVVRDRPPTPTATSTRSTSSACGARTCATTTATAQITRRRRRRSQPQLRRALGLRQRGLVARPGRRDLSRPERRLGARDAGDAGPDRPHQAEVPVEPALVRPVAAVPAGLADRHARRRQPDLRRARPAPTPTRRSRASTRASRPTRCTSPTARRPTTPTPTRARSPTRPSSARAIPGAGLRLPRRRGADPGRVREDARRSTSGLARSAAHPGRSGLAGRASTSSRSTSTRTTSTRRTGRRRCSTSSSTSPTATRRRCACSPSAASAPSRCSYQINGGPMQTAPTDRVDRRRALRARQRRPTTT